MKTLIDAHLRIFIVRLSIVTITMLSACSNGNILVPRLLLNVDEAEAHWKAQNIKSYTILQRSECYCVPMNYPLTVQVDSTGKIVSAKDSRGNTVNEGITIEQIFAWIRRLKSNSNSSGIRVNYDPLYGYPRSLSFGDFANDSGYLLETTLVR